MTIEPIKLAVSINERDSVTALLYAAPKKERAAITIILGHGAGAGQLHPFMRLFASGLAARGFDTITFNFIYMEQGRHVPDPKAKLEACYSAVIGAAHGHKKLKGNRLVIGGKSMGGRIASQVAALEGGDSSPLSKALTGQRSPKNNVSGLVLLGYPLHPPGRPDKLRDAHLLQIKTPTLFIQGERDVFGSADELRATIKKHRLSATLHVVGGGDHSLKVPKSASIPQQQVYESIMDEIARWLGSQLG